MVGEILHCFVGKAGCQFGQQYCKSMLWEHGLDFDGSFYRDDTIENYHRRTCIGVLGEKKSTIFSESSLGIFSPRAIFTDLSNYPIADIESSLLTAYDDLTHVYTQTDSRMSYSLAWQESSAIFPQLDDTFRRRVESCDRLGFVQIVGGIAGGSGSGLSSRILEEILSDHYGKIPVQGIALISDSEDQALIRFYNQMFAFRAFNENTRQTICLEPHMLKTCAKRTWGVARPYHINKVVAAMMGSLTSGYRYPTGNSLKINQQLKYLCTTGNLKFHTAGLISLREESELKKQYLRDVRASVFRTRDSVCAYEHGQSFASVGIYRGGFGFSAYSRLINDPTLCSLSDANGKSVGLDSTFLNVHNDTCMGVMVDNINHWAHLGYERKASFHKFIIDGIVEADDFVDVLDKGVDIGHDYSILEQKDNRPVKPEPFHRIKKEESAPHIEPRLKNFDGLVVILDIDETLMHCRAVERPDPDDPIFDDEDYDEKEDFDSFEWDFTMANQNKRYFVSLRPGVIEFFDWVSTQSDIFLCVWTAAAKPYAECALIHALGSRVDRINVLWHRKQYRDQNERKNLKTFAKYLGVKIDQILMIDDNKHAFSSSWRRRGLVELIDAYRYPEDQYDDEELDRMRDIIEERLYE